MGLLRKRKKRGEEEPSVLSVCISVRVTRWKLTCSVVLKHRLPVRGKDEETRWFPEVNQDHLLPG